MAPDATAVLQGGRRQSSLRWRFWAWFGIAFVFGAVALRLVHYQGVVDTVERDIDIQLWSRLAAVKAQERFAPDTLLDPHLRAAGVFLADLPAASGSMLHSLGIGGPRIAPERFQWFAGVWKRDGTRVDDLDLPAGLGWDATWLSRLESIWTTADGRYRLAATAGGHDTVLVAGTPLADLAAAERRAAAFQVWTFVIWVPLLLGIAWLILSRALVPLAQITSTARRIRAGAFEERLDLSRADAEVAEMAVTINDMLDRLQAIRTSQSRFNADLAHQLLNPVHAILLEASADRDRPRSAEQLAASLAQVDGLARRIEGICEVLLAYSRSAAVDPARLKAIDLEPVVAAAIDRIEPQARGRGVTVVPPDRTAVVKGDATLLEEVFLNLLANAVEHSLAGGRIDVTVQSDATSCLVAIIDHGTGVAAADLPALFERFHSRKPGGGHGIGLALSRLIARSHGGDILHEPTPGGGATFVVQLPASR
jgi:signal transduction histidine kinase